jgi:hypothetical protein
VKGDWTAAVLHVTEADPPPRGRHGSCRITGVLLFDDHPQREVITTLRAPTDKWPRPGDQLPAAVRLSALDTVTVAWRRLSPRDRLNADLYRVNVIGDPGRPLPGSPGGGATPQEARALIHSGEPGTALVLAVTDVRPPWLFRKLAPPGGVADLILQVTRADDTSYQARIRIGFSTRERRDRVATVGAELPVRIQPDEPEKVAVDTAALEWS